jgi:drug/metabolite transporter (DMT)-like permease
MIARIRAFEARGHTRSIGICLAAVTALVSGFSVFVNASAVRAFTDPVLFTTLKNGVAAIVLTAIALAVVDHAPARVRSLRPRSLAGLAVIGVIGGGIPFVLFFTGLANASAPAAAIIHKTLFVWVALLATVLLRERLGGLQILALAVLVVAQLLILPADGLAWTAGEWMIAAATGMWAVEVIVAKRLLRDVPSPIAAAARMGIGLVLLLGWVAVSGGLAGIAALGMEQWAWVLVTGGLLSAYVASWYAALRRAPASAVTAILTLGAPITAALQLVANGQVPAPMALAGHGAVLAAGAVIAWLALRPARATASTATAWRHA